VPEIDIPGFMAWPGWENLEPEAQARQNGKLNKDLINQWLCTQRGGFPK
jgi:hypothetical protein